MFNKNSTKQRTEREHKPQKVESKGQYTNTHLEHLEDLEETSVWEEGTVADRYAVPTPESHRKDKKDSIFLVRVHIRRVHVCEC